MEIHLHNPPNDLLLGGNGCSLPLQHEEDGCVVGGSDGGEWWIVGIPLYETRERERRRILWQFGRDYVCGAGGDCSGWMGSDVELEAEFETE